MSEPLPLIPTSELKLGMYVVLSTNWLAHPFARNHFLITSEKQLAIIRGLKTKEVQWDPSRSVDPESLHGGEDEGGVTRSEVGSTNASVLGGTPPLKVVRPDGSLAAPGSEPPEVIEQRRRAEATRRQRAAWTAGEQQRAAMAGQLRKLFGDAQTDPINAGQQAQSVADELARKLSGDGVHSLRMIEQGGGESPAAHALNVAVISVMLGRSLGMMPDELVDLGLGALLHDIGKLELPPTVQLYDDHFTPAQTSAYRDHVALGVLQARKMGCNASAMTIIAQHHEHADGTGFPNRVTLDRLSTASRIVAIVNRYDRLCNPANPGRALTPHEAIAFLFASGRGQYDPNLLNAFIRIMGVYPAGSLVQLTDDRYAMVMAVNADRPLKPRVLVYDPKVPRDEAPQLDLEHEPAVGVRASLRPTTVPRPVFEYFAPEARINYFFESRPLPGSGGTEDSGKRSGQEAA
jgi:putative nucleotidyltransferase with HDIG domain